MANLDLASLSKLVKNMDSLEIFGPPLPGTGGRPLLATVVKASGGYLVTLAGQSPVLVTTVAEAKALLGSLGDRADWTFGFS